MKDDDGRVEIKKGEEKKNLIFDLDETIISAISQEEFGSNNKYEKLFKIFDMKDMDGYYYVFSRPKLQKLLDYVFDNFNVTIWTAASKSYALFIIEKIILSKKERKLDYIFFDIKKSIVSFVDLSCQFFGLPADADRIKIESDMYNFVLHPSHLNKSVIREGNKIILGFKVCYECNMASLN